MLYGCFTEFLRVTEDVALDGVKVHSSWIDPPAQLTPVILEHLYIPSVAHISVEDSVVGRGRP